MSFFSDLLGGIFGSRSKPVPTGDPVRIAEVDATLERLRPMLRADGGDVDLVSIDSDGHVTLEWYGACASCAVNQDTLGQAIEPSLRDAHDWISRITVRAE